MNLSTLTYYCSELLKNGYVIFVLVITRYKVQYEKYFSSSYIFVYLYRNSNKNIRTRKIFPYCTNYLVITGLSLARKISISFGGIHFQTSSPKHFLFVVYFFSKPTQYFYLFYSLFII